MASLRAVTPSACSSSISSCGRVRSSESGRIINSWPTFSRSVICCSSAATGSASSGAGSGAGVCSCAGAAVGAGSAGPDKAGVSVAGSSGCGVGWAAPGAGVQPHSSASASRAARRPKRRFILIQRFLLCAVFALWGLFLYYSTCSRAGQAARHAKSPAWRRFGAKRGLGLFGQSSAAVSAVASASYRLCLVTAKAFLWSALTSYTTLGSLLARR